MVSLAGNTGKFYGPLAVVAAGLATALSSAELPSPLHRLDLGPAPYLLYAAHPSMPVPPLSSSTLHAPPPSSASNSPRSNSPSVDQVVWAVNSFVLRSLRAASDSSLLKVHNFLPSSHLLYAPSPSDGYFRRTTCQSYTFPLVSAKPSYPSIFSPSFPASDYIRSKPRSPFRQEELSVTKKEVTVVLLGWLGAKQKHLKKYADWYTGRGINAVTFVIPMSDVISLKAGGKAEQQIDCLANHLLAWLNEEEDGKEKHLFFHTFSNTGWLTYGVLLERLLETDNKLLEKVKGCVVDSAPVVEPDPLVWASGFSAAFLKKKSVATRRIQVSDILRDSTNEQPVEEHLKADVTEQALVTMLEKFFSVFLRLPSVNKRLSEVVTVLSQQQPRCPQLYFYSTADKVIPAKSVESFIAEQRKSGKTVKACNLLSSPHVDHFRSFPDVYSSQLSSFIHECLSQYSPQ